MYNYKQYPYQQRVGERRDGQQYDNTYNRKDVQLNPAKVFTEANFKPDWITNGADRSLPAFADKIGKALKDFQLTNSKIRSIYGELKRIQSTGYETAKSSFYLLRPKVAYAVGRDINNMGLQLFKKVYDEAEQYVNSQETLDHFCELMEAILAYHKAYGGKE